MTRLLADPLDASDVFLMTFMIPQDSYVELTRVGSDVKHHIYARIYTEVNIYKFYAYIYRVRKGTNIFTYILTPHLQYE